MALRPKIIYPEQVVPSDPGYPQGKAKNDNSPGDKSGTPLEQKWVNELWGWMQAMLAKAGITPSDLAETAAVSQYQQAVSVIAHQAFGQFDPRAPAYDAAGDGVADDTEELQACLDAAAAVGGRVDLGGQTYRVTATLAIPPNVDVCNGAIVLDAASVDYFLTFTDGTPGARPAVWENVSLSFADQAATMIRNTTLAVRVRFVNCLLDGSTGAAAVGLLYSEPASEFTFEECEIIVPVSATSGLFTTAGQLVVRGGKVTALVGFTGTIFNGTGGVQKLEGATFDTSAVVGGTATCVTIGGQRVLSDGCFFDNGASANANVAFKSALSANTGLITERGSTFRNLTSYSFAHYMATGSSVEGEPQYAVSFNGASVTIPATARSASIRSTNSSTTAPTINFSEPLYAGQPMDVLISNDHTDAWVSKVALGGVSYDDSDAALDALPSNNPSDTAFILFHMRAHRYEGSLKWYAEKASQIAVV